MSTHDDQQLISISGIAELTGLKMPTISNWRRREKSFPPRIDGTEARPLFSLAAVKAWIAETGKNVQLRERGAVMSLADLLRGDYNADEYHRVLFPLLALAHWTRDYEENSIAQLTEAALVDLAGKCATSLTSSQPLVADAVHQLFHGFNRQGTQALLLTVFDRIRGSDDLAELAQELTDLIRKTSWKIGGEHLSTPAFSNLLISLLPEGGKHFADFGSGYGQNLLSAAHQEPGWALTGIEINSQANQLAACLLYVNGIDSTLITENILLNPHEDSFDRITFHAPFGVRLSDSDLQGSNWPFGKPPRSNADVVWPQTAYQSLRNTGVAAVVVATGLLLRSGVTRDILKRMIAQGAIEAVVSLPAKTQLNTAIPVSILLIRKGQNPSKLLMVDVSQPELNPGQKNSDPDAILSAAYSQAIASLEAWRQGNDASSDVSIGVPIAELMAPDAVLLPQRWMTSLGNLSRSSAKSMVKEVDMAHDALLQALRKQPSVPTPASVAEAPHVFPLRTVPELGLEVIRGDFAQTKNVLTEQNRHQGVRVVTMKTVRSGIPEEHTEMAENVRKTPVRTLAGDILVTTLGTRIDARVWEESGLLVDRNVSIVRGLGQSWDPYFVAQQLTAEHNQMMLTGITIKRADAKQLLIAQLPLEAQREAGRVIREYSAFAESARQIADKADDYISALQNAASSGAVSIDAP